MLRAARRSGVDGARDEILAGAALAGDQHGQVVALQPLDLIGDALHRGAGADESRQQRLERPLDVRRRRPRAAARAPRTDRIPGAATARDRAQPAQRAGSPSGRGVETTANRGPSGVAAERLDARSTPPPRAGAAPPRRQRAGAVGVAPGGGDHARTPPPAAATKMHGGLGRRTLRAARSPPSRASSAGSTAASTIRRTIASSPSMLATDVTRRCRPTAAATARRARRRGRAPRRALRRSPARVVEIARRARAGAGGRGQPAELEVAESGLIPLAEQVEHADALAEVVVRVGRPAGRGVEPAAQPQKLAPRAAHRLRLDAARRSSRAAPGRSRSGPDGEQRFDGDQLGLERVRWRRVRRSRDRRTRATPRRPCSPRRSASRAPSTCSDHWYQRRRLAAVVAVGLARLLQRSGSRPRSSPRIR